MTFTAVEDDGGNGEEPTKGGDGDGDGDDSGAVCLCHIPPGNPDAAHTICVGPKAVAAHLAHGDTEGE
ncbi:MAG: hypothetical protein GWN79_28765, partial [Actinobacteria bacterium]|nr:hypothetical protein [Actinomycetota bacterium]NIT99185.1 hypothetical protein [Actinomycetota bacterium]NIU22788.1 hypothetical protein [Actinomycetota bacterium]NIV59402.1 hypothetical protein [Actinomycetota bacterium]NIX19396.1 hypothetical protein [Actinomycetota bacterium]